MDTSDFEAMERDGWANPSIAQTYARAFANATEYVAQELAHTLAPKSDDHVLDLCCGHGVVSKALLNAGAQVTGLDFSAAMVSLAEANVPDAMFLQGDAMAMGFGDATFDAVAIGFGVPHFPDPQRGLKETARVLKPGGKLAFSIWYGSTRNGAFGWSFDSFARLGDASIPMPAGPDAHQLVDPKLAEQMLTQAGFENMQMQDVPSQLWVAEPEDLFEAFYEGAVRAAERFSNQTQEVRDAVKGDLAERVRREGQQTETGWLVPQPSVVISATRA